jgi:hypothetical protein
MVRSAGSELRLAIVSSPGVVIVVKVVGAVMG